MRARITIVMLLALLPAGCGGDPEPKPHFPGVFVIGFDGMDPRLVDGLMENDFLPNFAALAAEGDYARLGTSLPPESPVAWSNFITGNDPGSHGIFDFIHRDIRPGGIGLYMATAKTRGPSKFVSIPFTGYHVPRDAGETELLVKGKYFWEWLVEAGIPASIVRVPSNYPPKQTGARTFPGMGTPDLLGTYGVFGYWTDDPPADADEMSGTANVLPVEVVDGVVRTELRGPRNIYRKTKSARIPPPYATVPLTVHLDRERNVARLDLGGEVRVLMLGEWSDWIPVSFPMIPNLASASGIVRFYLKEMGPHFRLYASPVNADPRSPDIELSTPPEACVELAEAIGPYYSQGMPEDTQARRYDVLDTAEFLAQAKIVLDERKAMLDHELARFRRVGGLTFFYVSTSDLVTHMLWQYVDPEHPLFDAAEAEKYGDEINRIYREMDGMLGRIREQAPEGTRIVVISDHGFSTYRRQLSLNTWLHDNGFLRAAYPDRRGEMSGCRNVDWLDTRAYAIGFTSIYLNLVGRESMGIVEPGRDAEKVKAEIIRGLESLRDPKTGERVITKVYRREEAYHGPEVENAPDLIVGFNAGYGCSDDSAKGAIPRELMKDTDDAWSGSHLMDPRHVPGIILSNVKFKLADPKLYDLPVSILSEFGIEPTGMRGRKIW